MASGPAELPTAPAPVLIQYIAREPTMRGYLGGDSARSALPRHLRVVPFQQSPRSPGHGQTDAYLAF